MKMNKGVIAVLFPALLLGSCTEKKASVLTTAQKMARLDSVLRIQQAEIKAMEDESLRDRMSIEVKEKTDSILAQRNKNRVAPVTTIPADTSLPQSDTNTIKP